MRREEVLGDGMLRLAYLSPLRGILRWPLFGTSLLSRLSGWYANSRISKKKIEPTIRQLDIDMSQFLVPEGGFASFNDFFCRHLQPGARLFDMTDNAVCSPADSRIKVWQNLPDGICLPVKGRQFTVADLLGAPGAEYAPRFAGGSLCICRLCPADYHRYHFPFEGKIIRSWSMKGRYHSVNPLALACNIAVFDQNVREITMLDLGKAGLCAYIEVGAFGVASINPTKMDGEFAKGDEKGYFTFGGSTVILVFEPNKIAFDQDLIDNSANNIESLIKCGEHIAVCRQ